MRAALVAVVVGGGFIITVLGMALRAFRRVKADVLTVHAGFARWLWLRVELRSSAPRPAGAADRLSAEDRGST